MFRHFPMPADFVASTVTILALLGEQADAFLGRRALASRLAKPSSQPILSPKMHVATEYDRIAVSRDNWPLPLTDTSTTKVILSRKTIVATKCAVCTHHGQHVSY